MISDIVRWLEPYQLLYRPARSVYRTGRRLSHARRRRREAYIAREFHRLFYHGPLGRDGPWFSTNWLGVPVQKLPMDLFIFQEILYETRPELIIECGMNHGGSTWFLASICDALQCGKILSCDITHANLHPAVQTHPRIELVEMGSTSPEFSDLARNRAAGKRTMVILDSDHLRHHVLEELRLYGPLVTPGCYLICEDTNINGHPVLETFGPGPWEALQQYLHECPGLWTVDAHRERLLVTFNPGGYLRRNPATC
jgi:cephalosporin hydroxylase